MYAESDSDFSDYEGGRDDMSSSDGESFSDLDSDLFEKDDDREFDFFPNTSAYNKAGLTMDDDLSVGSDDAFRPTANPKLFKMGVREEDELSLDEDDQFQPLHTSSTKKGIQFIKKGGEDLDNYLGGGGRRDAEEEVEEPDLLQFPDEGDGGAGGDEDEEDLLGFGGGEDLEEYHRREHGGGGEEGGEGGADARSRALLAAGLAHARGRAGGRGGRREPEPEVEEGGDAFAGLDAEAMRIDAEHRARIDRSLANIRRAVARAEGEEERERVEDKTLGELDEVMTDIAHTIEDLIEQGLPHSEKILEKFRKEASKIQAKIDAGMTIRQIIDRVKEAMELEARIMHFKIVRPENESRARRGVKALKQNAKDNIATGRSLRATRQAEADAEDLGALSDAEERLEEMLRETGARAGVGSVKGFSVNGVYVAGRKEGGRYSKITFEGETLTAAKTTREKLEMARGKVAASNPSDPNGREQKKFILDRIDRMIRTQKTKAGEREKGKPRGRPSASGRSPEYLRAGGGGGEDE